MDLVYRRFAGSTGYLLIGVLGVGTVSALIGIAEIALRRLSQGV